MVHTNYSVEPVHFPAPKTYFEQDIFLEQDTPIFATSSGELKVLLCIRKRNRNDESEMESF